MTYANLMVAMMLGRSNAPVLSAARELASKLHAGVVGVASCRPIEVVCGDLPIPAKVFDEDRKQCARQSAEAEQEFRSALGSAVGRLEWRERSTLRPLADQLAHEARSADLLLVGSTFDPADRTRSADIAELVMNVGRPVLIVPASRDQAIAGRVLVGWKDTRETHRAIADAIPLLQIADDVVLGAIASAGEQERTRCQMAEVAAWLKLHGISVRIEVVTARGSNASQFDQLADEVDASLIVIGGYGHLRQSQWMLGGITAAVLHGAARPTLLSH
jgi:nucleotide-binding universal stress UspA family protein